MTALNFLIQDNQICFAMDTLSISAENGTPHSYITKYILLPHLQTVVTGTGNASFVAEWMNYVRGNIIAKDIDHLNLYTPDALSDIAIKYNDLDNLTVTIYHFGFSEPRDRFLGYVYRSTSNWKSEELLNGFGVKPAIKFELEDNPELPNKFIELMEHQRQEDLNLPVNKRVGIGGDVHFVHFSRNGLYVCKCHRFSSYEIDYQIMCNKLKNI